MLAPETLQWLCRVHFRISTTSGVLGCVCVCVSVYHLPSLIFFPPLLPFNFERRFHLCSGDYCYTIVVVVVVLHPFS